ncbi:hypothetical protein mRhiFer1_009939 [Rhinolophus ferrumequinum]|uniref:Uncharacterized protein n=1 Tax=Rhinolophus ferrumequinum TaxID=59479 RepID=A0A7J7YIB8_RHIFE|nr:hypothetical protein mRhiFer1_009939 [Rhinolophus ferrumequinum]
MGERPICPWVREGTGCHSNQRAETEQPRTKRPKQRMPIAPRRPQDPRDAPPLMPSRSAGTPAAPPARPGGGEAKGREGAGDCRQPPSLLLGCHCGPRPLSLPIRSRHRPALLPHPSSRRSVLIALPSYPSADFFRSVNPVFLHFSPP